VAAFDSDAGGAISAGGVDFDISCGVRTHLTGLPRSSVEERQNHLPTPLSPPRKPSMPDTDQE
jgi:tRNA-splicing ligase RtcB